MDCQALGEKGEQFQAGFIGPVQVFEHKQQWTPVRVCQCLQSRQDTVKERLLLLDGRARAAWWGWNCWKQWGQFREEL